MHREGIKNIFSPAYVPRRWIPPDRATGAGALLLSSEWQRELYFFAVLGYNK